MVVVFVRYCLGPCLTFAIASGLAVTRPGEAVLLAAGSTLGAGPPVRLVAEHGRLFTLGDSIWDISTRGGGGKRMRDDVASPT